jgi:ParB family chromosome partitioning protein
MTTKIRIVDTPIDGLQPNRWNSNQVGPEMERRLEASMQRLGCYKPIIVRELKDGSLEILGGQHRWQVAKKLGFESVPVVNLGAMSDRKAKEIGLADNGRYGEDDALKLAEIIREIGQDDVVEFLPYTNDDLAGIFAAESIDLEDLSIPDEKIDKSLEEVVATPRATITHALMRFKVPVEDQERVEAYFKHVIQREGLSKEDDSAIAAGMALVAIVKAAKEVL